MPGNFETVTSGIEPGTLAFWSRTYFEYSVAPEKFELFRLLGSELAYMNIRLQFRHETDPDRRLPDPSTRRTRAVREIDAQAQNARKTATARAVMPGVMVRAGLIRGEGPAVAVGEAAAPPRPMPCVLWRRHWRPTARSATDLTPACGLGKRLLSVGVRDERL